MPLFVGGIIKVRSIKPRVKFVIKFLYSLGPILQDVYQLNNNYYFLKKSSVGAGML